MSEARLINYFTWELELRKEAKHNMEAVVNRLMNMAEKESDYSLYDLAENILDTAKHN